MNGERERREGESRVHGVGGERRTARGPDRRDLLSDRYELLELLGRGGSASVWHAYDKRLAREVALKIFHLGTEDREDLGRALREAKAASHIVSDHVVRIRDVAWGGAKGAYIDMELCADSVDGELVVGRSIAQTPPRDLREAVRWVLEAARGVQTAHELRVFHRDLKPDNILIRPASRSALVTDFGLARQPLWREEGAETPLPGAQLGATFQDLQHYAGTPPYMAPEQADGLFRHLARLPRDAQAVKPDPADEDRLARIDVYGLGAILYECLAGQPPYRPRHPTTDRSQEALDVLAQVRAGPPPPLPIAGMPQRVPFPSLGERQAFRVPRRLERIVRKAMARDPQQRYATCAALERDLARFLQNRPTSFERHRLDARALLWGARNWRPLLASSIAIASFVAFFSLWPGDGDRAARVDGTQEVEPAEMSEGTAATDPGARRMRPPAATEHTLAATYARGAGEPSREVRAAPAKAEASRKRRERTSARPKAVARAVQADPAAVAPAASVAALAPAALAATAPPPPVAGAVPAPPAPHSLPDAAPTPNVVPPRLSVAAFMESARRSTTPLIQVLDASGAVVEYCLSNGSGRGAPSCVSHGQCSSEERERLDKLHRQSTRAWIWHLDAQRRVIRKCEKSRPYDNSIIRKTCDPVVG